MSYLAIYRKYRPNDFRSIIGQEHVVRTLVNQVMTGSVGHAYLFTGTRGIGKTTAARVFAKAINCDNPQEGSPCGVCASCVALSLPNIDVIEMDGASNNRVDEARELKENAIFPPTVVRRKVYIIDEVHMLTGSAFNALLKIIEEPPAHVVFILCTTESHKIPPTILSRCMRFDFRLVSAQTLGELLSGIFQDLKREVDEGAIRLIASSAQGSVRDAQSLADRVLSAAQGRITYKIAADALGITELPVLIEIINAILTSDIPKLLRATDAVAGEGKSVSLLARDLSVHLRDMYILKVCGEADFLELPKETEQALLECAKSINEKKILYASEIFTRLENELRYSSLPRIVFETAAVRAATGSGEIDADDLSMRISALERQIQADVKKKQ